MRQANPIERYVHCKRCVDDIKAGRNAGQPPREYARLEVGWTVKGFRVRCVRHDINVLDMDFLGQKVRLL